MLGYPWEVIGEQSLKWKRLHQEKVDLSLPLNALSTKHSMSPAWSLYRGCMAADLGKVERKGCKRWCLGKDTAKHTEQVRFWECQ
jgi:hypothetical protein